jgi:hypothetical protein
MLNPSSAKPSTISIADSPLVFIIATLWMRRGPRNAVRRGTKPRRNSLEWQTCQPRVPIMPASHPIWKGQLRLSLVSIAVELYTATKSSFRQIHEPIRGSLPRKKAS